MSWVARDLKHIWHPCTQMKDFEPIMAERASGLYIYDKNGRRYADMISSWWCNLLGHCNPGVNQAVKAQLDKLEHVIFANFTHDKAIELCERLIKILPAGLEKFFFTDNGSSAIEAAMKMSFQYFQQSGSPQKTKFMALTGGYHGETLGALSAGALDLYAQKFKPLLLDVIRLETGDFEHAEKMFAAHGHETCALVVEPILQMAAGMKIYAPQYLKHLHELCDKYNVHLIADEIATGFGRTGKMFACEHAGISPDIMCLSKGLTGGYLPLALAVTTNKIYEAFYGQDPFLHSHTYCANPLACAAAVEVLKIFERDSRCSPVSACIAKQDAKHHFRDEQDEQGEHNFEQESILQTAQKNAPYFARLVKEKFPNARSIGLINAFEVPDGAAFARNAIQNGVLLRPLGNTIYFNPPLTITRSEFEQVIEVL